MKFPVLVCDDSLVARKQVAKLISHYPDFEVVFATNGEEAWSILNTQEIGLLCLDLTMPVLDGIGLLSRMKTHKLMCHTIVISADIQPQMKHRVLSLGALDFIEKPVNSDALTNIMHKFGIY